MKRLFYGTLLAFTTSLVAATAAVAQVTQKQVQEVLETSKAENVLGNVATEVIAGISRLEPGTDTIQVAAAVRVYFSPDSLLRGAVEHLSSSAEPEMFAELYAWLLSDSIRSIDEKADSAAESQSLEEYAQQLQARQPPDAQVQMAVRFARAQKAGEFYVRYITSLQRAALEVAEAAGMSVPDVSEPSEDQRAAAVQQFGQAAVISFLQRFEALTDEEIAYLAEAYESRSGEWYVEAYTDAIVATLRVAGSRTAAAIR